jgi:putative ATPase
MRFSRVFVLEKLTDDNIKQILIGAVERISPHENVGKAPEGEEMVSTVSSNLPKDLQTSQTLTPPNSSGSVSAAGDITFPDFPQLNATIFASIISLSTGDARTALSLLEMVLTATKDADESNLLSCLRRSVSASYDRTGDSHYDMISALHKSVRGSQGSAAMYWLARMLVAGEDPLFIARRMVVCASEDIGLADRHALPLVSWVVSLLSAMMDASLDDLGHSHLPCVPKRWNA